MTNAETDDRLTIIKYRERLDVLSSLGRVIVVAIVGSSFFLHRPDSDPLRTYIQVSCFFALACIHIYEATVNRRLSRLPQ